MARKRHGGLGRGLDALIPQARPKERIEKEQEEERAAEQVSTEKQTDTAGGAGSEDAAGNTGGPDTENSEAASEKPANTGSTKSDQNAVVLTSKEDKGSAASGNTTASPEKTESADSGATAAGPKKTESADSGATAAGPEKTESAGSGAIAGSPEKTESAGSGATAASPEKADNAGSGEVRMLRLSQVDPNRSQPRRKFEDETLEELAESIRQFGVLQPILVQKKGSRYEIIAGERRWRASRKAGLREIPAIVREYSDQETLELSLIENIQREDLNPIEEAAAYRRLLDEFGMRQEDLAERVSKSRTAITNSLRLLKLEEQVQDMLVREELSMGHARALLPIEIPEEQVLLAQEIVNRHLSVREVEKLVKSRLSGKSKKKDSKKKKESEKDPALELAYRSIEERLKQSLGTKAVIHGGADGTGRIEIDFYSHEDLEKIIDLLT